jgi:hypothetical protein
MTSGGEPFSEMRRQREDMGPKGEWNQSGRRFDSKRGLAGQEAAGDDGVDGVFVVGEGD